MAVPLHRKGNIEQANVKSDKICKLITKHRSKVLSNADNHNGLWLKVQVTGKVTEIWLVTSYRHFVNIATDKDYVRSLITDQHVNNTAVNNSVAFCEWSDE